MKKMNLRKRLAELPEGYALAVLLDGDRQNDPVSIRHALETRGVLVLKECNGAEGVLRGLAMRMRNPLAGRENKHVTIALGRKGEDTVHV